MAIEQQLKEFGLNEKEAKIYLAALELGRGNISDIAKKSGVNRATIYTLIDGLKEKGLIGTTVLKKKKLFVPSDPEELEGLLDRKRVVLKKLLPQLRGLENIGGKKPKIQYFEGEKGIVSVFLDNLNAKTDILTIAGEKTFMDVVLKNVPDYIERRVKNKIPLRMIVPDTTEMKKWKEKDVPELRKTRLVAGDRFPFTINIDIYNDKIAMTSVHDQIGLIIESRAIAGTLRSFFELTWSCLGA